MELNMVILELILDLLVLGKTIDNFHHLEKVWVEFDENSIVKFSWYCGHLAQLIMINEASSKLIIANQKIYKVYWLGGLFMCLRWAFLSMIDVYCFKISA